MKVSIGPVQRESVLAWLDYADEALVTLREHEAARVDASVLETFSRQLAEWRAASEESGPFHWVAERRADQIEYMVNALYEAGLAIERLNEAGLMELRPAAADEFHFLLVNQVLAALDQEGGASSHLVETLRGVWGVAGE